MLNNISKTTDYRDFIRERLMDKVQMNKNLSIRNMAKKIGFSHTFLSLVINKKKHLSRTTAHSVADYLSLSSKEYDIFLNLVEINTARSLKHREKIFNRLIEQKLQINAFQLPLSIFSLMYKWYYLAILELTKLKDLIIDSNTVAKNLGITKTESKLAIDRLISLGLLKKENNRLVKVHKITNSESVTPNEDIRNYHKDILHKTIDTIDNQSIEDRYLSSMTVAISKEDLPQLKEMVDEFKMKVSCFLNKNENKNSVYQINFQAFELSQSKKKEKKNDVNN